jgi:hypothetical protein
MRFSFSRLTNGVYPRYSFGAGAARACAHIELHGLRTRISAHPYHTVGHARLQSLGGMPAHNNRHTPGQQSNSADSVQAAMPERLAPALSHDQPETSSAFQKCQMLADLIQGLPSRYRSSQKIRPTDSPTEVLREAAVIIR